MLYRLRDQCEKQTHLISLFQSNPVTIFVQPQSFYVLVLNFVQNKQGKHHTSRGYIDSDP